MIPIILRPDQAALKQAIYNEWNAGHSVVAGILATGGGKSIVSSDIILDGHRDGLTEVIMAHRNELVGQMSMHVARRGIPHRIIGSSKTVSGIIQDHRTEFGRSFVNPDAKCSVGSVQTIVSRLDQLRQWGAQVDRFTGDEGHHFLRENMWGKAARLFTNARGLLVTACPQRADGAGLGSHADGIVDAMVVGPPMRELIDIGALSDYEIVIPQTDFEIGDDAVTQGGDYSPKKMRDASKRSHIVSDAVIEYQKWTNGKKAICFATDVETANDIAARFNAVGIVAASVSAKTDEGVRRDMIRRFRDGRLLVLVNVDLFDEGFDVPDCEVVIMARPTASLNKFLQMFGRGMRRSPGKAFGIVIDLVSNVLRHGLPDRPRVWTLDRRDKRAKKAPDPDEIALTACRECSRPYERCLPRCPYCGAEPVVMPGSRTPEQVDGDLVLLDRETLATMRAAMTLEAPADVGARVAYAAGEMAGRGAVNRQMGRIGSQAALKDAIEQWAGIRLHGGDEERTVHRRFYLTTGMTVLQAMALSRSEMDDLRVTVEGWYSGT